MRRRLRILWISHFVPYPPKGGCFQRSYNLITRVGAAHDVHLLALKHKATTHPEAETCFARDELLRHCQSVAIVDISDATKTSRLVGRGLLSVVTGQPLSMTVFRDAEMRQTLRSLVQRIPFDVIHFDTIGLADYLPEAGDVPVLMTHHGAESHMIRRRIPHESNLFKRAFFVAEWLLLRRYERRLCPQFDLNLTMSDLDRQLLEGVAPRARFAVVPNGVDVDYFVPTPKLASCAIVFAGRLDQYSNRDGILYFMREVWPGLIRAYPNAVIHLVGSNPPAILTEMSKRDTRVHVHGFVPDVRPYFQNATVAICPNRDGGGTRIKVFDALAQGMPIVSTSIACEGIDVVPERDVLIADSASEFQRQIGRVFEDAELRAHLAGNARRLAETRYSWDAIGRGLVGHYERLAGLRVTDRGSVPAPFVPGDGDSSATQPPSQVSQ